MKKIMVLAALTVAVTSPAILADSSEMIDSSRATVKDFATQLKGELVSSMKSGGPIDAISVCNIKAPEISQQVSAEKGMEIARTSLKLRNANNEPDEWERAVLASFEQRKAAGEVLKKIEFSEIVDTEAGKEFRYMKAIPTGEPCLACHGESISQQVITKLDELYPDDKARGFKLGDIRGAFTVRQMIE